MAVRGWPDRSRLLESRGTAPDRAAFRFYFVFGSKEAAEEFAKKSFVSSTGDSDIGDPVLLDLLENIRPIDPGEIDEDHYVVSEREGLVKWGDLVGGRE